MRFAGGVQWTLIVVVGFGTFWNYFHKRLEAVHAGAMRISGFLANESVRERYKILEAKVKPAKTTTVPVQGATPGKPKKKRKSRKNRHKP